MKLNYNNEQNRKLGLLISLLTIFTKKIIIWRAILSFKIYSYLCNFDSSYDFDSFTKQITRKIFSINDIKENIDVIQCIIFDNDFENEEFLTQVEQINQHIIKSYHEICSVEKIFYRCNRKEKPIKYRLDYEFSCPDIYNNIILLILGFISIIFNFIISLIIFLYEFLKFRKMLIIYHNINNFERLSKTSLSGTTKNSSQIKPNSNNNNTAEINVNSNSNINSRYLIIDSNAQRNERNSLNENNINSNNEFNNENILSVRKKNSSHSQELPEESLNDRKKINFTKINLKESRNELIDKESDNNNNTVEVRQINLKEFEDGNKEIYLNEVNNIIDMNKNK